MITEIKTKYNKYKEIKNKFDTDFEKQNEVLFKLKELEESVKEVKNG